VLRHCWLGEKNGIQPVKKKSTLATPKVLWDTFGGPGLTWSGLCRNRLVTGKQKSKVELLITPAKQSDCTQVIIIIIIIDAEIKVTLSQ